MGLFYRGYPHTEEEAEYLVSLLPGFQGIGHDEVVDTDMLRNSDIFTAIMMIASDLAKMDIQVKKDGIHSKGHKTERLINKAPNGIYDGYTFKLIV